MVEKKNLSDLAVALDADGVVIRSEPFTVELEQRMGIGYSKILPFFKGAFQDCIVGKKELRELLPQYLEEWGWAGSMDALIDFWFQAENKPDQQLLDEASQLRGQGAKLFLATNQERNRLAFMRNEMGFDSIFDHCFASCEIGFKKPDTAFYEAIASDERMKGCRRVVFFDDRENNVDPVRELGWDGIVYRDISDFLDWKQGMLNT